MWLDAQKPRDYENITQIDIAREYKGLFVDFLKKTWKKITFFLRKKFFEIFLEIFWNFFYSWNKEQVQLYYIWWLAIVIFNR